MTIVDELLKADVAQATERETGVFLSSRLQKILKREEPVEVKLRAIKPRRLQDLTHYALRSDGKVDYNKTYDANLLTLVEGIIEPDLSNEDLQKHFGAASAKELAEVLFGMETNAITAKLLELSGVKSDAEDEVKN